MDYQLQYLHVFTGVVTVVATQMLASSTEEHLGVWVRDRQTANPCPPECSSWLYTEEDPEFIPT